MFKINKSLLLSLIVVNLLHPFIPVYSQAYKLVATGTLEGGQVYAMDPDGSNPEKWVDFSVGNTPHHTNLLEHNGKFWGMTEYGGSHNAGVIFSINTDGTGYQKIYDFNISDGGQPTGSLVLSNDKFWGTTSNGGDYDKGVIFNINTDGTAYSNIHSFGNGSDGWPSYGSLIEYGSELWGITYQGGMSGHGTIYKLNNDNSGYTIVHNFDGINGRGSIGANNLLEYNGKFYGMGYGGTNDHGIIFSINTDGTGFTKLYDFDGVDGGEPYGSLIEVNGELYGMTSGFGAGATYPGTVFKYNLTSGVLTVIHQFENTNLDGASPFGDLVEFNSILYGMTSGLSFGSNSFGTIFKMNLDGSGFEVLKEFTPGNGTGGHSPYGSLVVSGNKLWGMTSQGEGNKNGGTIFSIDPDGSNFSVYHKFEFQSGYYPSGKLAESNEKLWGTTYYGGEGGSNNGVIFSTNIDGSGFEIVNTFSFNEGHETNPLYAHEDKLWGMARYGGLGGFGLIYYIRNDGTDFTIVHNFNSIDGASPFGSLVESNGKLWGMTNQGGLHNLGVIFNLNTDGTGFTKVHDFDDTNGSNPYGDLLEHDGKLWGMTQSGGESNWGIIFTIDPDGTNFNIFYEFGSSTETLAGFPYGTLVESNGKLWGKAQYGGGNANGAIFYVDPDVPGITKVHEFDNLGNGSSSSIHYGSLLAFNGYLYGNAFNGGANRFGLVYRIKDDGTGYEKLFDGYYDIGGDATFGASFITVDQNHRPTFTQIPVQQLFEDQQNYRLKLTDYFNDIEDGPSGLGYTVESISNASLFASTPISSGNLDLVPASNAFGTADITVRATDTGGKFIEQTFTVNILAVADNPSVTSATSVYGVITSGGLVVSRNPADGDEVSHVRISDITNGTLYLANGTTVVDENTFITMSNAAGGFRFIPDEVGTASFNIQASVGNAVDGLGGSKVQATITVGKKSLAARAVNKSRKYGAANPPLTISYAGFVFGENSSVINTLPAASTSATVTSNTGSYDIDVSGGSDDHYEFTYTKGTFTITKADLTVTADDKNRNYGTDNPELTFSYSGFLNGDSKALIDTPPAISTAADQTSAAGTYPIVLTGGLDNNYNMILQDGTLTVNKLALTATADNKSKVYGTGNPGFTITYSGFLEGETAEVLDVPPIAFTDATAGSDAGDYPINLTDGSDTNYEINEFSGTLTITKAGLVATADDKVRSYGEANPAFTISYSGFVPGDDASMIDNPPLASASANSASNAGNYAITLSAGTDNNYTISLVNGTLKVVKALLTAVADDKSKVYGEENPELTVSYSGFFTGDDETVLSQEPLPSTLAIAESDAGAYAISLAEGYDDNYDIVTQPGTLIVKKAFLTVRANNATKVYGEDNPEFSLAYSGFLFSDGVGDLDVLPQGITSAVKNSDAGNYPVEVSGGSDNNYQYYGINGIFSISKASLTATADDKVRAYGESNPALTVSYSGFISGDNASVLDIPPQPSTLANELSNTGNYTITLSAGTDNNYSISVVNGNLAVEQALLTASAEDQSRSYGEENPALTISYSGFVNGDGSSDLTSPPLVSTAATAESDAGTYAITLSGGLDDNYEIETVDGTLTINRASLTVTAGNASRTYGTENPAFELEYSGFLFNDGVNDLDELPQGATSASLNTDVGEYTIEVTGGSDNNYSFDRNSGILTITKASLMAVAEDTSLPYGFSDPEFPVSYTGLIDGDDASMLDDPPLASTVADGTSDPGSYEIMLTAGSDNNYEISTQNGTLTITKAVLKAVADDKSRIYGEENPELTISYEGFANDETEAVLDEVPVLSTLAVAGSDAGTYVISVTGGFDDHYGFELQDGTLTIAKADQVITFEKPDTVFLDEGSIELSASASSGLPVSFISGNETIAVINGNTVSLLLSGDVVITAQQEGNQNYNAAGPVDQVLTIRNPVGVTDIAQDFELSVYPNPAQDYFTLQANREIKANIHLVDPSGKVIEIFRYKENGDYDISRLTPGIYHLVIEEDEGRAYVRKLSVIR